MADPAGDTLTAYGWDPYWAQRFARYAGDGLEPARVILEHTHIYTVATARGDLLARVSGRLRHSAAGRQDFPAVGDWVACRLESTGRARIHAVLPRRSRFSRKMAGLTTDEQIVAANIDTIFIVMGCDQDFNLRRLERYLVLARESGARPVVLLNKADKCPDGESLKADATKHASGAPVHLASAKSIDGLAELATYLGPGETVALLGSSGVGKSTIINRLAGHELLRTAEVRESDSRGRHTTRHRQLVLLPGRAMLIDTPGMRELQLWDVSGGVEETFDDIATLAAGCRFRDCEHRTEPGCAVRDAVARGDLPLERLEHYLKLQDERREMEEKVEQRAQQEAKRKGRIASKALKTLYKVRGRR